MYKKIKKKKKENEKKLVVVEINEKKIYILRGSLGAMRRT